MNDIVSLLRKHGYRVTPQRLAICEYVLKARNHPTAKDVYREVKKRHPAISMTTIYQTLKILEDLNLIRKLPFDDTRIESNLRPHINLICLKCGKIEDLESDVVKVVIDEVVRRGFKIASERVDVFGYCRNCKK